jgi:hypothetical protein
VISPSTPLEVSVGERRGDVANDLGGVARLELPFAPTR